MWIWLPAVGMDSMLSLLMFISVLLEEFAQLASKSCEVPRKFKPRLWPGSSNDQILLQLYAHLQLKVRIVIRLRGVILDRFEHHGCLEVANFLRRRCHLVCLLHECCTWGNALLWSKRFCMYLLPSNSSLFFHGSKPSRKSAKIGTLVHPHLFWQDHLLSLKSFRLQVSEYNVERTD